MPRMRCPATSRASATSGVWKVIESRKASCPRTSSLALATEIRDWLLLIPDYDGSPHELERFAASVRYVGSRLSSDERALLLALDARLRGRAREVFGPRLHRLPNIEALLGQLRLHFAGLGSEEFVLESVRRARQREDESVEEFGTRLERLASQLRGIYEGSGSEVREMLRDAALISFRRGLRSYELELRIAACEPESLEEAVAAAVAVDRQLSGFGKEPFVMADKKRHRRR